jgi:hypothetical protein
MVTAIRAGLKFAWRKGGTGGPCTSKLLSMMTAKGSIPEVEKEIASYTYGGEGVPGGIKYQFDVKYTKQEHEDAYTVIVRFVTELRENLKMRFPKNELKVLCALDVFDASELPPKGSDELELYGREAMDDLLGHYGRARTVDRDTGEKIMHPAIIDDGLLVEWDNLKDYMVSMGWCKGGKLSNKEVFKEILTSSHCKNYFPMCCYLIQVKEVQFLQTAICERGFSEAEQTKTAQRTSMGPTLFDVCMRIKLNGPSLDDKESVVQLCMEGVRRFKEAKKRCAVRSSAGIVRGNLSQHPVRDALSLLLGDAINNDDIESSDEEEPKERVRQVEVPDPRPVDLEQEARDEEEELAALLAKVGKFELPTSHSSFTIHDSLDVCLPDMKSRWAFLQKKVIAHKHVDGWKVGNMWKKGTGKYGGLLWVIYCTGADRGGHDFDPEEYGVDRSWVILTPPPRGPRPK